MDDRCLLVGDVGGTNARFALANPDGVGFTAEVTLRCRDYPSPVAAIRQYLATTGARPPAIICLAAAGPVIDGSVQFTNNDWCLDTATLDAAFAARASRIVNDFEAIAWALPHLRAQDCTPIGNCGLPDPGPGDFTVAAIGPGTGLGAAGLVSRHGTASAVVSEAGHVGFAPETQLQAQVRDVLLRRFDRVSDERVVSGAGLENVYVALQELQGHAPKAATAAEIFARHRSGGDPVATATVGLVFDVLGQAAGNLALTLGAFDGIFVVGGIAQRHGDLLPASGFRRGFEAKGRHRALMERVPTVLVRHPQPGLLGASAVALDLYRRY